MESQTAEILRFLARPGDVSTWEKRAHDRAERINKLMWDKQAGLYFDYEFVHRRLRPYPFLTTFYPLWAGLASPSQAAAVVRNLPLFERPGGLQTSAHVSGNQWDAPFAWAPLELIAVQGLRRYAYNTEANRISKEFLSLVFEQYQQSGIILEKYDAVRPTSRVSGDIHFGYSSNEAGFGWTNGVFTTLFDELPEQQRRLLSKSVTGVAAPANASTSACLPRYARPESVFGPVCNAPTSRSDPRPALFAESLPHPSGRRASNRPSPSD